MGSEAQQPLDGGTERIAQAPSEPEAQTRITAETVREAQQERERIYCNLMDQMEQSVPDKGQYFVKFGDKNQGVDKNIDTRGLLLIRPAVDKNDGSNLFIAFTREGAKGLRFIRVRETRGGLVGGLVSTLQRRLPAGRDEQREAEMKKVIESELQKEKNRDTNRHPEFEGFLRDGRIKIPRRIGSSSSDFEFPSGDTEVHSVDVETVKTAIEESQSAAEIPHSIKLEQEEQRIQDASSFSDVIKQLPPKQ